MMGLLDVFREPEVVFPLRIPHLKADIDAWTHLYGRLNGRQPPPGHCNGLLSDFEVLRSERFDPDKVAPIIRDFYARTTDYSMEATVEWKKRLVGAVYGVFSGFFMQLSPGSDRLTPVPLHSKIARIDLARTDGHARLWRRTIDDPPDEFYTGVFYPYVNRDKTASFFLVSLPLFFGNFSVLFEVQNGEDGGLILNATHGDDVHDHAGNWVVLVKGKRRWCVRQPGLSGEKTVLSARKDSSGFEWIATEQTGYGLGGTVFRITYRIKPKPDA